MTVLLIICTAAFFALTTAIRRADSLRLRGLIKALGKGKAFSATVVGILLVYFTFGIFPALKNPDLSSDTVNKWLSFITRGGVVNQHVTDLERNLQVPYLSTFAYGASYISTPIVTFTYFMEDTDVSEWYLMGSHNLPQFSRILSYIGGNRSGFISTRERIEAVSAYGRNPFKTGVTDMIMDFSIVGAVMLMFLLGWLSQILFATCLRTRHQELVVAYSLVVSYLVAFPLFSLSYVGPFSNTLMLVLAISGVRSLSIALSRAAAGVRETRILARRDAENPS